MLIHAPVLRALSLTLVLASIADADPARHRVHLVTHELMERLSPGAQKNERAIVEFPHATGFVVASDAAKPTRVLLLTNYHVAGSGPPFGNLKFRDGTVARAVQVVASNDKLDYALVEADLVSGPRRKGVEAVELDARPIAPTENVYSMSAHADLLGKTDANWLGGGNKAYDFVVREQDTHKNDPYAPGFRTIQRGAVYVNTRNFRQRYRDAKSKKVVAESIGIAAELPNAPGMSGSPVFARDSHAVVGLHFSGAPNNKSWSELSVPMHLIVRDLGKRLARGQVVSSARDLVGQIAK